MASITGLHGATGEDWYSWPVGTIAPVLTEITSHFSEKAGTAENISASIKQHDAWLASKKAFTGGIWAPRELEGIVAAYSWATILSSPEDDTLRSARRYERSIQGRTSDGTTIVFSQYLTSFFVQDTEAIFSVETRGDGDGAQPYILARAVYFPTWTKDRVIFEARCSLFSLIEDFTVQASAIASTLTFDSSDS